MKWKRSSSWIALALGLLACDLGSSAATPSVDLFATLSAATPLVVTPAPPVMTAPLPLTPTQTPIPAAVQGTDVPAPNAGLPGKIVFTCNVFKNQLSQICIVNADGSGFRRLTQEDATKFYYPSLAPAGRSVVYAGYREDNIYEIYEMNLDSGLVTRLTDRLGNLNAPEISPDGSTIVFKFTKGASEVNQVWLMDRNGANPRNIPRITGWDPTWSPDGKSILFASDRDGSNQLYTMRTNGKELKRLTSLPALRGRSDWSPDGKWIVTYSGEPWQREVYLMSSDGTNLHVISPPGGNAQGPAFSPDGQWVVFTAYYDHPNDENGCEIYIMRTDGSDLRRVTNNDTCDYQPRWGP